MPKDTTYSSLTSDADGRYPYSAADAVVWKTLFIRQMAALPDVMVPDYFEGVKRLELTAEAVPQVIEIDARLQALTDAGVEGVPALIAPTRFFALLAQGKFPVATFLRRAEHMDYIEEPDLFHEVFGHCPLLTNQPYADFIRAFGQLGQEVDKSYRWHLFRLFWFTIEFGMIRTPAGLRGYGAGIASSPAEAANAMGGAAQVRDFDLEEVLRTPYRIDIVQPVYFAIDHFDALMDALRGDVPAMIDRARARGDLPALFEAA